MTDSSSVGHERGAPSSGVTSGTAALDSLGNGNVDKRTAWMKELKDYDDRFATTGTWEESGSAGEISVASLTQTLQSAEVALRPWIGVINVDGHLWDAVGHGGGSGGDVDYFLSGVELVLSAIDTCRSNSRLSDIMIRANSLLKQVLVRLEEEFRYRLEINAAPLPPQSVREALAKATALSDDLSDHLPSDDNSLVHMPLMPPEEVDALHDIAQWMIRCGSGKECLSLFRQSRLWILEQCLPQYGLTRLTPEQMVQMHWQDLEAKVDAWLQCIGPAIRAVFASERALCDAVFNGHPKFGEACFTQLTSGGVEMLFGFSEAVARGKRSPEKLFRVLEMYEALRDLTPHFEAVFAGVGCTEVRHEYNLVLLRLSEAARDIFSEFESAIERDASKPPPIVGAVHGLTRYVVNYLILLYDYRTTLQQLFEQPEKGFPRPPVPNLGEEEEEEEEEAEASPETSALAATNVWKLHVLAKNLESKARSYQQPAQGHLFLMTNLHYIALKVKGSELRGLMGDDWIRQQAYKVRDHANAYQKLTWNRLLTYVKEEGPGGGTISKSHLKERFKLCNAVLEDIHAVQSQWLVPEESLREELRAAITERVLRTYQTFCQRYAKQLESGKQANKYIKYGPEDVELMIQELYKGPQKK